MPNATQPARFTIAIDHGSARRCPRTAAYATAPETRKQMDPSTSGDQTSRSYADASRPVCSARNVLTLKKTVPANWMRELHLSNRSMACKACSNAADVKKIEPTKKTTPSTDDPTSSTNPGNGATRKHAEPTANRTPVHHAMRCGAHQTPASLTGGDSATTGRPRFASIGSADADPPRDCAPHRVAVAVERGRVLGRRTGVDRRAPGVE